MSLATAPVRRSARIQTGWRSRGDWDICSLGWEILDWTHANLPDPRDKTEPLVLTDEQARRVIRIYELDPMTGRRLYSRVHQEEAKGWGKGPLAAILGLAEFGGAPVVFDGWANGQPVGKPWGSPGLPPPYVQVVAVSEAQTFNVWQQVMILSGGARGDLAKVATVDSGRPGRTMLRRRDIPAAELARVTASAISREGALVVHSILDEVQLWTDANAGDELARVVLRNLDKSGGWAHFLSNAPVLGLGSVAEAWREPAPGALHLARRPSETPEQDWHPERLRLALVEVYGDVPWIDIDRQLESVLLPQVPWSDTLRLKFNIPTADASGESWLPADAWKAAADPSAQLDPELPIGVGIRKSAHSDHAAVVVAQRQGERVVVRCRTFPLEAATGRVSTVAIRDHLRSLRSTYPRAMVRDEKTRRNIPGPAFAFDRVQFEESAEMLEQDGLDMIETNHTAAVMAPPTTLAFELVTTGRLVHDGDPVLAEHIDAARVIQTERGIRIQPPRDPNVRPSHAAIALVMAVAMAMQEAPKMTPRTSRSPVGI